jgi:DNA-binding transcriptional regulator PaaX
MGNLEKESRKRTKKANIRKVILQTVAVAGVLSVGLLAPNVLYAFKKLGIFPKHPNFNRSRNRLVRNGLLKYEGKFLRLTEKGQEELMRLKMSDFTNIVRKKWDGKWRILTFDIPESRRKTRDNIRQTLHSIGFYRLQNSVWIYPYDCEDYINLLKSDLKIGKDLLYIIADSVEYDKNLKKAFNLK